MKIRNSVGVLMSVLSLAMLFASCGKLSSSTDDTSSSSSNPTANTTIITGNVSKGSVNTATVNFYAMRSDGTKGDLLDSATTDADGAFEVSWTVDSNSVLAETSGGFYINEVTSEFDTLDPSDKMTAVIPALPEGYAQVAITPLTHMAAARAFVLVSEGIPLATAIDASNIGVAQQYDLTSIIETLPASANIQDQVNVATRDQREYGLVLAGIAQEADDLDVRAIDLTQGLAIDMEDGILDGLGDNPIRIPSITGPYLTLPATMGITDLQRYITLFEQSGSNLTQLAGKNISAAPVIINPTASSFYITAAALPAWIAGQAGTTTLTATGGTGPYTWSVTPGSALPDWLTLNPNGTLTGRAPSITVPGSTGRISTPFSITCTDSTGQSQSISWTATIVQPGPTLGWLQIPRPRINASYDQQIAAGSGGSGMSYYCKLDTMGGFPPLGLILTPDCHLKGTPRSEGAAKFRICVIDMVGASDCGDVEVTVDAESSDSDSGSGSGSSGSGEHCYSTRSCVQSMTCSCTGSSSPGQCLSGYPACTTSGGSCINANFCCVGLSCINGRCGSGC